MSFTDTGLRSRPRRGSPPEVPPRRRVAPAGPGEHRRDRRAAPPADPGARLPGRRTGAHAVTARPALGARARAAAGQGNFYALCSVVALLSLIGLVMVLSASSVLSLRVYGTPWHFFERQLLFLVLGGIAFAVATRVDPRWWRRLARPGMCVAVLLLLAVLVPHVGVATGGASRWLGRGSFEIQPSELAKMALIFFAADVIDRRAERGAGWRYQMGPVLVVLGILAALVMKQPDMGTTMVLIFIGFAMVLTAGMPAKPIVKLLGVVVAAAGAMAVVSPYRWRRITSFLHPARNAQGSGYQAVQGLAGLSDGGLLGQGIGSSISSWGFLPNAHTDFIFAVIGEETGLVGSLAVASLFVVVAWAGIRIACRAEDRYLALVAAGVTAWITGQALINIGAVVGLLPVTGVPLPFVSYGGSSLVIILFAVGILGAVARRA